MSNFVAYTTFDHNSCGIVNMGKTSLIHKPPWGIDQQYLSIFSTLNYFMAKFLTIKTVTIETICIPDVRLSSPFVCLRQSLHYLYLLWDDKSHHLRVNLEGICPILLHTQHLIIIFAEFWIWAKLLWFINLLGELTINLCPYFLNSIILWPNSLQ